MSEDKYFGNPPTKIPGNKTNEIDYVSTSGRRIRKLVPTDDKLTGEEIMEKRVAVSKMLRKDRERKILQKSESKKVDWRNDLWVKLDVDSLLAGGRAMKMLFGTKIHIMGSVMSNMINRKIMDTGKEPGDAVQLDVREVQEAINKALEIHEKSIEVARAKEDMEACREEYESKSAELEELVSENQVPNPNDELEDLRQKISVLNGDGSTLSMDAAMDMICESINITAPDSKVKSTP